MAGREKAEKVGVEGIQLLQGTLDMIVLRTLAAMGPQHAYQIATRLEQVSEKLLNLNQGTLYPALVRLERHYLSHPVRGGWYDQFDSDGKSLIDTIPASSFYHVFCAVAEAEQVLEG